MHYFTLNNLAVFNIIYDLKKEEHFMFYNINKAGHCIRGANLL